LGQTESKIKNLTKKKAKDEDSFVTDANAMKAILRHISLSKISMMNQEFVFVYFEK
jgi:hypothetical protein